VATYDVDDGGN